MDQPVDKWGMKMRRLKLLFVPVVAASVGFSVAVVGGGVASAKAVAPVDATGTVSCSGAAGLVKLSPSFTNGGTATSATAAVKFNLNGCSATNSNVTTTNFTGHAKGTITTTSNDCGTLMGTQSVTGTITVRWTAKAGTAKLNASTLNLTSLTGVAVGTLNGNPGLQYSGQAVSGSFTGTSSAEFDSAQTATSMASFCARTHGLHKITFNAGVVTQP
jgi:hypothetical protein